MCFWLFSADPPLPQSISMRDAWIPCPLITAHIHQGGYTWSLIIYFGLPKVNPSFRKLQVCDKKYEYHCFRFTHLISLFCNLTLQLLFPWPISALIVFLLYNLLYLYLYSAGSIAIWHRLTSLISFLGGWLPDCITSSRHTTLIPNQPATWSRTERLFGTCLNNLSP